MIFAKKGPRCEFPKDCEDRSFVFDGERDNIIISRRSGKPGDEPIQILGFDDSLVTGFYLIWATSFALKLRATCLAIRFIWFGLPSWKQTNSPMRERE